MVEIKDKDILEVFKLGEKNPGDKVLHGITRSSEGITIVYERNEGEAYTGFLEKSTFDISKLNENQMEFLRKKGYEI